LWYQNSDIDWDLQRVTKTSAVPTSVSKDIHGLIGEVIQSINANRESGIPMHIVIMSNGGFEGFHQLLLEKL